MTNSDLSAHDAGGVTRYNVTLPIVVMENLKGIANRECTSVLDVLRKFIKLGFLAASTEASGGRVVLENGGERTVVHVL